MRMRPPRMLGSVGLAVSLSMTCRSPTAAAIGLALGDRNVAFASRIQDDWDTCCILSSLAYGRAMIREVVTRVRECALASCRRWRMEFH